jgi:hypothetical protein
MTDPARTALALLPLLLTLGCVFVAEPDSGPRISSAAATCDPGTGIWTLEAQVAHEQGWDEVRIVAADVSIAFRNGSGWDLEGIGTVELVDTGSGHWSRSVGSELNLLDCGFGGAYGVNFVAEDRDGDAESLLRIVELADRPILSEVDAYCDDEEEFWILRAVVDHPRGVDGLDAVWVEVHHVLEDGAGEEWLYLDDVGLAWDPDYGDWYREVDNDPNFLDCLYPGLFGLRFVATDVEGDQDRVDIVQ